MEILYFVLMILVFGSVIFWQGSCLFATIIGSPIVYSYKGAVIDSLKLAGVKKGDTVVDLGCGDGRSIIIAAKEFGAKGIGVDRSLYCYFKSNLNALLAGQSKNVRIIWGSFDKAEKVLKNADVVYLYLLNSTLKEIEPWIFKTIGEKTKIVSLAFWFPNKKPIVEADTFTLGKVTKTRLYKKS